MSFLAPFALALSVLAAPILMMYMLRLRRREMAVSSTMLWQQVLRDREANAPWQRLRRNLLLLLQLLILAALIFALARPSSEVPTISAGRTALLLDASASMNATDVQPSRFEAARQQALALVDTLGTTDTLSVIRVGAGPEVLASYTNDRNQLRTAIQNAQPGTTVADWNAALTLAAAGFAGAEKFTVIVIGDGGLPANLPAIPGEVRYVPIGQSDANVAVSALATAATAGGSPQLYARLTNYGAQAADVIFSVKLDDTLFNAQNYTLAANGSIDVVIPKLTGTFQHITASVTRPASSKMPDYLAEDDTAYAIFNSASGGRALLMTAQNKFLDQGFASLPDWSTFRGQLDKGLPSDPYDLYVFDSWLPAQLPDANILIINPPANSTTPLFSVSGQVTKAIRGAAVVADDPRTAAVKFDAVNVRQYVTLSNTPWAAPLISTGSDPLLVAGEYRGHRVAILTFDLHDSDLPLQIAWPILLSDLTTWFKTPHAISAPNGLNAGQTLLIQPAPDADRVRVHRPDGSITTLTPGQDPLVYADTALPGFYAVEVFKGSTMIQQETFAVNLFEPLESHIAPAKALQIGSIATQPSQARETGLREYWPWIALLALIVLAIEWAFYQRGQQLPRNRRSLRSLLTRRPSAQGG